MTYGYAESDDPGAQLQPYLRPGEQLLWVSRPDPAVRFTPADGYLIPFSILWGGFALSWEAAVLASGAPPFFVLFGLVFACVGLYFIFGHFIVKARRKRRTAYGLTADRAMVAEGTSSLSDSPVKNVPTSIRRSNDGRHVSITFGNTGSWRQGTYYANTGMDFFVRGTPPVAFFDVADPEQLLATLSRIQSS